MKECEGENTEQDSYWRCDNWEWLLQGHFDGSLLDRTLCLIAKVLGLAVDWETMICHADVQGSRSNLNVCRKKGREHPQEVSIAKPVVNFTQMSVLLISYLEGQRKKLTHIPAVASIMNCAVDPGNLP